MQFNYPNGKQNTYKNNSQQSVKTIQFGKRGMSFETMLNESNDFYNARDIAVVHKKPTPIQVVKVDYPKRSAAKIVEAYYRQASTTDYNGVFNGHYIDFEAKETRNKTSFPLKNFHAHQIQHMDKCNKQHGICFILVYFSELNRCFFLPSSFLIAFWEESERNGKKSITLQQIEKHSIEINIGLAPQVPYIDALTAYISMSKTSKEKLATNE